MIFQNISLLIKLFRPWFSIKPTAQQNKKPMSSLSLNEELQTVIFFLHSLCLSLSIYLRVVWEGMIQPWGSWVLAVDTDSLLRVSHVGTYLIALSLTFSIRKMNKWKIPRFMSCCKILEAYGYLKYLSSMLCCAGPASSLVWLLMTLWT